MLFLYINRPCYAPFVQALVMKHPYKGTVMSTYSVGNAKKQPVLEEIVLIV